jgi:hypothetical protein
MPDELPAMPGEVRDVFAREQNDTRLIWQRLRQDEAGTMGRHRRVGMQRDRLCAIQAVIACRDRHDTTLRQQSGEFGSVIRSRGSSKDQKAEQSLHGSTITNVSR